MEEEIWKDVEGWPGYKISNLGNLISCRTKAGKESHLWHPIRPGNGTFGYPIVVLKNRGKSRSTSIHRLVAEAFIPNPENKPHVAHSDNNPKNCRLSNLRWATAFENCMDKKLHGTHQFGEKHNHAKLTEKQAILAREMYLTGEFTAKKISEILKLPRYAIRAAACGQTWRHLQINQQNKGQQQ